MTKLKALRESDTGCAFISNTTGCAVVPFVLKIRHDLQHSMIVFEVLIKS